MNEELQFDRAEMPSQETASCRHCQAPLRDHYFQANGAMLCDSCVEGVRQAVAGSGSSAGRFTRALLLGGGAALLSAIGYGMWMGFMNSEFALITIGMGWLVGKAVRHGSQGRGGWRYGLLAVLLTYAAISFSYFGVAIAQWKEEKPGANPPASAEAKAGESATTAASNPDAKPVPEPAPASGDSRQPLGGDSLWLSMLVLVGFTLAMPVIAATQSILSLLITGFGLWQAWSMNRAVNLEITGPHLIGDSRPAGA